MRFSFVCICFLFGFSFASASDQTSAQTLSEPPLVLNGDFEKGTGKKNLPEGWRTEGKASRFQDPTGNWKLKLSGKESDDVIRASQTVVIPEISIPAVTVAALVKAKDIQSVDEDAKAEGAVLINFLDEKGDLTGKPADLGKWEGTFGWRPWAGHARIPAGAKKLELVLELRESSGSLMFDEVRLVWGFPEDEDRLNFIVDGGFEYPSALSSWIFGGGQKMVYPGFAGHSSLSVSVPESGRSVTTQQLVFDPEEAIQKAKLEFYYRLEEVKALEKNGGARIEIEFQDQTIVLGPWTGSFPDWKKFSSALTIPPNASTAQFRLIMEKAKGTAQFDAVRLSVHSKSGALRRPVESRNDTRGWKEFKFFKEPLEGALDISGFVDPPAGRHGFLKTAEDGHFYFEDGKRARFFGINLQPPQSLPTHEEADQLAARLSQHGFNLVRLHHLDAPFGKPNLFRPESEDTQHFSKESLDRLGYFIAQLKSRGIYIYLDLLVSRKFRRKDGVPGYQKLSRGAKGVALFNRRLIELQKKYAQSLFNYKNPYTDLKLKDEPAIVLTEIANENSLCRFKKFPEMPAVYEKELEARVGKNFRDLFDSEVQKRYAEIQKNYFLEMRDFLKDVGVKIPMAGTNFALDGLDLETNALLDFIDRHAYWDPPQGGVGDLVRFHNGLITREIDPPEYHVDSKRVNPIVKLIPLRVPKKPFVVGEWNIDWPNEYRAVGPLLFAAYASLEDWDAIIQFNYESKPGTEKIESNFDVGFKPEIFLQYAATARLFHRSDVSSANEPPSFMRDTPELKWDDQFGRVWIKTPRTQGVLGTVGGERLELSDAAFEISNPYAAVSLTSLDEAPLRNSHHLLLTATARSENKDTVYNVTRTLLRSSGTAPILVEPVGGRVFIPLGERKPPQVFILDFNGKRQKEFAPRVKSNAVEILLGEGFIYEIIFG